MKEETKLKVSNMLEWLTDKYFEEQKIGVWRKRPNRRRKKNKRRNREEMLNKTNLFTEEQRAKKDYIKNAKEVNE